MTYNVYISLVHLISTIPLLAIIDVTYIFALVTSGQALVETGESYRQLAEVKYSMEDNVKQNFIEPLQHLQNKDLKEVNVCKLFMTI